jgi:PAS domain S-box-containing protein
LLNIADIAAHCRGGTLELRIAELKRTETALAQSEDSRRSSEEKFEKVFRSSPVPFSITTMKEGRFVDVNAAFERRYGYSCAEVLGRSVHELGIWEHPADREFMIAQPNKGGPIRNIMTGLRLKSGEVKVTACSASRIQFEGESCILAVSEGPPQIDRTKAIEFESSKNDASTSRALEKLVEHRHLYGFSGRATLSGLIARILNSLF